jgi:hypothetical protein
MQYRARCALVWCHWVSCHAHDNDNDIKWGPYVAHVSTYMRSNELWPWTRGLSKPRPGDRSPRGGQSDPAFPRASFTNRQQSATAY